MKYYPHIKSKRWFVRERRKSLGIVKKAIDDLRKGCAMNIIYGKDVNRMMSAVTDMNDAIRRIDEITKRLV